MISPRTLSARSVVLSILLGAHPACATAAELINLTVGFDIKDATLRVALTRLVAAGDLERAADGYRLAQRLLVRQRRQDAALHPRTRRWRGEWRTVVITAIGEDARTRAALRTRLGEARFAELREGVWLRPDNLDWLPEIDIGSQARIFIARNDTPVELAATLWDLDGWAAAARDLLAAMRDADSVPGRFGIAAAMVRHLLTDPVLPEELLGPKWPGADLRAAYVDFAAEFGQRRGVGRPVAVG